MRISMKTTLSIALLLAAALAAAVTNPPHEKPLPRATCLRQCAGLIQRCPTFRSGKVKSTCLLPIIRDCRHRRASCLPGNLLPPCINCWLPPTTTTTTLPPCASLPPAQQLARFCAGDLTCHPLLHPEACLTFCRTLPPAEACAYSSCAGLVLDCSASPSGAFIEAR
jgi:hypothetical protein